MLLLAGDEEGEGEGGEGGEGDGSGSGGRRRGRRFEIVDEASAVAACSALHSRGPGIVVLTSVAFPDADDAAGAKKTLTLYASQCRRDDDVDNDDRYERSRCQGRHRSRHRCRCGTLRR